MQGLKDKAEAETVEGGEATKWLIEEPPAAQHYPKNNNIRAAHSLKPPNPGGLQVSENLSVRPSLFHAISACLSYIVCWLANSL